MQERSDFLNALVNLNDRSPLQWDSLDGIEHVGKLRHESLELLEDLWEIKMGMEIIKNMTKGRVDKNIQEQFTRINSGISRMTEKLLESRHSD